MSLLPKSFVFLSLPPGLRLPVIGRSSLAAALALGIIALSSHQAEAKRLRNLPGTNKVTAPTAKPQAGTPYASPAKTNPATATPAAPQAGTAAAQPASARPLGAAPSAAPASSVGVRPVVFFGVGSANAATAEERQRPADPANAAPRRVAASEQPTNAGTRLLPPMLGQGGGESRASRGFESVN